MQHAAHLVGLDPLGLLDHAETLDRDVLSTVMHLLVFLRSRGVRFAFGLFVIQTQREEIVSLRLEATQLKGEVLVDARGQDLLFKGFQPSFSIEKQSRLEFFAVD